MQENILKDDLGTVIRKLTWPGYLGMLGMNVFNIIDTYYVAILGAYQLAAMTYTFSVAMIVNLITIGLGVGIGTLTSKAVGTGNHEDKVNIIVTGLFMSLILALTLSIIGMFSIDPLFKALGADSTTLPYVKQYMIPWYLGSTFLFISMVGGQIFRGLGDTKTPGYIMILSAIINCILDPIMIFGLFSFPALGMSGAAIATVISRFVTFILYLYLMQKKYDVFHVKYLTFDKLKDCATRIFIIGLPNSLTKVVSSLIVTFITYTLASVSQLTVAGYGVGTKIESFIVALAVAFGNTAMAVLGQNYGAGNNERVKEGLRLFKRYSLIIFTVLYFAIFFLAPHLARIFTDDPATIRVTVTYLRILPLSYAMQSIYNTSTSFYNIKGHPYISTVLGFSQLLLIVIPIGTIAFNIFGVIGLYFVVAISYYVIAIISMYINKKLVNSH